MDITENESMNCLFIGPLANHAVIGRVAALVSAGLKVYLVNASAIDVEWLHQRYPISQAQIVDFWEDPFYRGKSRIKRFLFEYLRILDLIPESHQLSIRLKSLVTQLNPEFIVVHYGAYAIHYARIIKRSLPQLPVIDIINLLPSYVNFGNNLHKSFRGWWGFLEEKNYRHWLGKVDGVVFASSEMADYAKKNYGFQKKKSIILPDYLPMAFQGKVPGIETSYVPIPQNRDPKVIFLGAPERYGEVIDNLDDQFMALANENIHIFSGAISNDVVATGFGHCYPKFSDQDVFIGKLAEFSTQFDAAIITYNIPERHERFRSTYPTRLFSALTAGIPIAIKGGHFDACERFVTENEIGFVYTSPTELRKKLTNSNIISEYRINLRKKMHLLTSEAQGDEFRNYFEKIIKQAKTP